MHWSEGRDVMQTTHDQHAAAISRVSATARVVARHVHDDRDTLDRDLRGALAQLLHQIEQAKDTFLAQEEERSEERQELQSADA